MRWAPMDCAVASTSPAAPEEGRLVGAHHPAQRPRPPIVSQLAPPAQPPMRVNFSRQRLQAAHSAHDWLELLLPTHHVDPRRAKRSLARLAHIEALALAVDEFTDGEVKVAKPTARRATLSSDGAVLSE